LTYYLSKPSNATIKAKEAITIGDTHARKTIGVKLVVSSTIRIESEVSVITISERNAKAKEGAVCPYTDLSCFFVIGEWGDVKSVSDSLTVACVARQGVVG
tara:strand:- start:885 stop:1187 length:303 start_codon:yes stop_codon:yes gene_type:complete